jgi:5-methylthioadenosine/S-adenosylhomocysteine deaminase
VVVGLGTDSLASNTSVRVLSEAVAAADESLSPAARLSLATLGGAAALAMDGAIGTLDAGKQADLAAFAIADSAACDRDPERYLLEFCAEAPSVLTAVAGEVRARHGIATELASGRAALAARMASHCARVAQWAGERRATDPRFNHDLRSQES